MRPLHNVGLSQNGTFRPKICAPMLTAPGVRLRFDALFLTKLHHSAKVLGMQWTVYLKKMDLTLSCYSAKLLIFAKSKVIYW